MGEHSQPETAPSLEERTGGRASTAAEEAFASYLELVEDGLPVDFEAFCRARPDLQDDLQRLREHWQHVQSVVERLGAKPGVRGERRSHDGREVSPASGAGSELFQRLSRRERAQKSEPRYRLKGEISRGGMGAILRVWDEDLRRALAMKVVLPRGVGHGSADKKAIGRFVEEAQITGQLDHPGIVPVHELGLDDQGRLFFTMRLVQGDHLGVVFRKARQSEEGWTRTRVLGILLRVCEAMAYAHEKGVVHRDLKPANIMVGRFGEAYVMDWGLARVLGRADTKDLRLAGAPVPPGPPSSAIWTDRREELSEHPGSPLLTVDGDVIGTPSYMAPEQARGKLDELGPATDVYSVGAILYELLAGRAPYLPANGSSLAPHVVWHQVLAGPPRALAQSAPDVSPELAAICERAMAREAAERYPNMGAMAEDLRAFLENRVVRAYRTGALVELRKWIERNRAAAAALAALLVVALCAALAMVAIERRRTEGIRRYSDIAFAQELVQDFEERGPIDPEHVAERTAWLARAEELAGRRAGHEVELASLRARALPLDDDEAARMKRNHPLAERILALSGRLSGWETSLRDSRAGLQDPQASLERLERLQMDVEAIELEQPETAKRVASMRAALEEVRPWVFAGESDQLLHTRLSRLEQLMRTLLDEGGSRTMMESELAMARELARRSVDDSRAAWAGAIEAIAASPHYGGLTITPQMGLVPLGADQESGLWEFHHVLSGSAPERGLDGRWSFRPETGIVLVLVPGGTYTIGAQRQDPAGEHFDPVAHPLEGPPCHVELAPWFHGKYELTQGQWVRLSGENPSSLVVGEHYQGYGAITRTHPVESVSWDAAQALHLWGLELPSEAQWEAAARARTVTPFWFGERFEDGAFLVNYADASAVIAALAAAGPSDDGFPFHAPVDQTHPNPFGIHATLGNVMEWCRGICPDDYGLVEAWEPDGRPVTASFFPDRRPFRGGAFISSPLETRVSRRTPVLAGTVAESIGLRPSRPLHD